MAEKPKSVLLPVMAAAVFAGLGRMVVQKIRADRAARKSGAGRGGAGQDGAGQNRVAQNRVGRGGAGRGGKVRGGGGQDRVAGPVDEKTRQWISEVVRTPRQ
ncbi:hypothetical protein [Arthrobacter sp. QXT-31]|uniref:hypothetical protein n=1 Tax=Arthrobacter sp. QXT-31 TaxID=1357915 RepID=UPI000971B5E0|nr:hypothetical protein [Arthrobacter sp. QXT-31]APX01585.1 hypothetical protein BWQ92_07545 [Arthrobacter sp. QXT-31]